MLGPVFNVSDSGKLQTVLMALHVFDQLQADHLGRPRRRNPKRQGIALAAYAADGVLHLVPVPVVLVTGFRKREFSAMNVSRFH